MGEYSFGSGRINELKFLAANNSGKETAMKIFFLCATIALCALVALGWQQSCQTSWNGTVHVGGRVDFTPGGTTANLTESSPNLNQHCPSQEPPLDYYAVAQLVNSTGSTTYEATKRCGGCQYYDNASVTTTETWTMKAYIEQLVGSQTQSQGPVVAYAADPKVMCLGE